MTIKHEAHKFQGERNNGEGISCGGGSEMRKRERRIQLINVAWRKKGRDTEIGAFGTRPMDVVGEGKNMGERGEIWQQCV
jgi:hypothetical protein